MKGTHAALCLYMYMYIYCRHMYSFALGVELRWPLRYFQSKSCLVG